MQERPGPGSEAICCLVEIGLKAKTPERPAGKPGRMLRAEEFAWKTVGNLVDRAAAPREERAQRQRRLTNGPEEFREVRADRPTAKGWPK
jgi:hypothetical protein